jgi:hypothetical protein
MAKRDAYCVISPPISSLIRTVAAADVMVSAARTTPAKTENARMSPLSPVSDKPTPPNFRRGDFPGTVRRIFPTHGKTATLRGTAQIAFFVSGPAIVAILRISHMRLLACKTG